MLHCNFFGDYNSGRIFKIGQYLTKLCVEHLGFTFLAHPVNNTHVAHWRNLCPDVWWNNYSCLQNQIHMIGSPEHIIEYFVQIPNASWNFFVKKLSKPFLNNLTVKTDRSHTQCESKNPLWSFLSFFPNGWKFFVQILHAYCVFLLPTLEHKFLFNYLHLRRSYAIAY